MANDILNVPYFARIEDYFGLWAYEPTRFYSLWQFVQNIDMSKHMAAGMPQPAPVTEMVDGKNGKSVAVIKMMGTLLKGQSSMGNATSTIALRRAVRDAAANPQVAQIALAIDSPGGSVAGTQALADDVKAATKQKPVWAIIDDLGASAAYWVASQADRIVATGPTTLVGNIGNYINLLDTSGAVEKSGIRPITVSTGPLKAVGAPGTPITDSQVAYVQGLVNEIQSHFDQAVKSGRGLSPKMMETVRSGAVYPAGQAMDLRLIDAIQSLDVTLAQLAKVK